MKQQAVSASGGSWGGGGRAKALPLNGLRGRTRSALRYGALVLSWTIFCLIGFALSEFAACAQLPPVQNPLVPGQNPATPGCSTTDASSCAQAAAKLLPIVMGPSLMEENLRRLTDEIGGRVSGSPEMARAVEWAVAAFRTAGIEVHTEKYTLPATWSEGETRLALLGPVKFPLRLKSTGWSPATPQGGIEAGVIDVGKGSEDDFAKVTAPLRGTVLLIHSDIGATWADLFNEYLRLPAILDRAVARQAARTSPLAAR